MTSSYRPSLELLEDRCVPATFTVKNLNDAGNGSLRQAILNSNGDDTVTDKIVFKTGLKGTINLASQINITDDVKINGPGANKIKISGQDANRIFFINDFDFGTAMDVRISKLTLTRGNDNEGGAIHCTDEALTLTKCIFSHNFASDDGGAVYAAEVLGAGSVTVDQCQFLDNFANFDGGAIYTNWPLVVRDSTFSGNRVFFVNGLGGAIHSAGSETAIENSVIRTNMGGQGGGIFLDGGALTIHRTTIADNIAANFGGGLLVQDSAAASITSSTISGNAALTIGSTVGGGGIATLDSNLLIQDSTVSGNASVNHGGGIFAQNSAVASLTIQNSTIAYNRTNDEGGGIYLDGLDAFVASTIVARNLCVNSGNDLRSANVADDFFATYSLIESTGGATIAPPPPGQENIIGQNPLLGPLQNNGGPTQTHALPSNSPAINAGSNPAGLTTDQRGGKFKRVKGGIADIGAFER